MTNLINEATLNAAKENKKLVDFKNLEFAKDKILLGRENKSLSSVMTEEEKKVTAIHEAGHALVALLMPENDPLHKVSIIPRGRALGITSQLPEKDRYNYSEEYLFENLCILYGGRSAEKLVLGKISAGAQNDIERATELARNMVCELGMSPLGPINYSQKNDAYWNPKVSEETMREIDVEIKRLTDKACGKAESLIKENLAKLHRIASVLMERETLGREEIEELVKEPA